MPVYEYRCNDCHATFELLRGMGDRELSALCPSCESRASMPLISQVAAPRSSAAAISQMTTAPRSGGGCCGGGCGCG
ncbi:MAG TPA: zinc ribbon domain-containing protein [Candidatus Dormibacteraeota bacterium]